MSEAFGGDGYFKRRLTELVKEYNIQSIVETGTYEGWTTRELVKLAPTWTVEAVERFAKKAGDLGALGIKAFVGRSYDVLDQILSGQDGPKGPILFFLDAHGPTYHDPSPLPQELEMIAKYQIKDAVIIIHDFHVPGTDFGYDEYCGQKYVWEWIKPYVDKVYGDGNYEIEYNTQAEGARSGILYIKPKKNITISRQTGDDAIGYRKSDKSIGRSSTYDEYQKRISNLHIKTNDNT